MHEAIIEKNNDSGLSRVVSTFDYLHKKDGGVYYITEDKGNYKIPWNITDGKYTWAEKDSTIKEAGSIYTIQGFDLNYVGVILGPSITYDKQSECLVIKTENYKDVGAFAGIEGIENVNQAKEKIILNSMNVLMKRRIEGLYIYASDEALRERLLELQVESLKK
ncbi:DNA/RNA helicase domain-containing protein [Lysinibacillus xylanilyticus]|uniref:DNA/RNA helicase domain-containing protein n=1 Tax=Lysinibacillus xylanilyticus TaxID=582475 RepID=UPI0038309B04